MSIDMKQSTVRGVSRIAAVVTGLALGSLALPAFADEPETWTPVDSGEATQSLLLLAGIALACLAVIALLVYVPSMIRGNASSELALRDEPEWFGGPRKGADAVVEGDAVTAEQGGASARW